MSSDDGSLKPQSVPTPPPGLGQLPQDQLPGEGRLPMRTGVVVVSAYTREQLGKVGWQPGDPIPGDLGLRIQELQREITTERSDAKLEDSELAADWKPPKAQFANIGELPQEKQDELRAYLAEHKQEVAAAAQRTQQEAEVESRIPASVQGPVRDETRKQLLESEAAMARRAGAGPQSEVIDDRAAVAAAAPPAGAVVPEGKEFGGNIGRANSLAEKMEKAKIQTEQAAAAAPEAPASPEAPAETGAVSHLDSCPRCAWPLDQPFTLKPTNTDKQAFIASILGVSRFQKKVELLGGNIAVYFRSLTTAETAAIQFQIGQDVRNGSIHGDGEYIGWLLEYRLVISLSQIDVGGNTFMLIPPLEKWAEEHPPTSPQPVADTDAEENAEAYTAFAAGVQFAATPLPRMREWFYKEVVPQEPMRRIVGDHHREFQRLTEALEAMTSDSSFWKGIEMPAS